VDFEDLEAGQRKQLGSGVIEKDSQIRQVRREDATDHKKWRKLI